ncbi:MAG TPA: hypothetical protein PKN70_08085 [Smithellaceae bacterium]|nr:hypothetical protein [Smithellaceae bacterium]
MKKQPHKLSAKVKTSAPFMVGIGEKLFHFGNRVSCTFHFAGNPGHGQQNIFSEFINLVFLLFSMVT